MSSYTSSVVGIVLSNPVTQNPATLVAGGYVTNTTTLNNGDAFYGTNSAAWNFTNYGTLNATGTASSGLALATGGTVSNGADALIAGVMNGIYIGGSAGNVTNFGTITGTSIFGNGVYPTPGTGVLLDAGGYVANGGSGATGALISGLSGVFIQGPLADGGTVVNHGTIHAANIAVFLDPVNDTVINAGAILSDTNNGVSIDGALSAVVVNSGTIGGRDGIDIAGGLSSSNYITNGQGGAASALIAGTNIGVGMGDGNDTLVNFGTIAGGTYGVFVNPVNFYPSQGTTYGTIENHGTIVGGIGIYDGSSHGAHQIVTNFGMIAGTAGAGVVLAAYTDRLVNFGTIVGSNGTAVAFGAGADVVAVEPGAVFIGGLAGFSVRDTIDFVHTTVTSLAFLNGTLTAYDNGTAVSTLSLPGLPNSAKFTRFPDGSGGTDVGYDNGIRLTLGGTYTSTVVLNDPPTQEAVVVAPGGVVAVAYTGTAGSGVGIRGTAGFAWTLTNYGTIGAGTGTGGPGVAFYYGGSVTNGAAGSTSALISDGVFISEIRGSFFDHAGRVVNYGTIQGGVALQGAATITNFGTIAGGANAYSGIITNFGTIAGTVELRTGTIANTGAISGGRYGVFLIDGAVLVNSGTITAQTGAPGVYAFNNDAVINDGAIIATGGTAVAFKGGYDLLVLGATSTLVGSISGFNRQDAIDLVATVATGASYASGTLTVQNGTATVDTLLIADGGKYDGVGFLVSPDGRGGTDITLQQGSSRVIGGTLASPVLLSNPAYSNSTSIVSTGRVSSSDASALFGASLAATLSNFGTVVSTATAGAGVYLGAGGRVTNSTVGASGGYISGARAGVLIGGGAGTVTNSGTISGGIGVAAVSGANLTVTNSGTITGTAGTAVSLAGGDNRLIVAPGAAFAGVVDGGGGASVLEITAAGPGSGPAQGSVVYVSLGSVTNFSALQIDPGAATDADGNLTFDTLVNEGQINLLAGDSLVIGTVAGAATGGTIDLKSGGSVHIAGAVAAGQTVLFRPPGGTLALDHPEQFAGALTQFASTDTIDLPLGVASFQQYSGGVLSFTYGGGTVAWQLSTTVVTPQFLFTPDGQGGTDITVSASGTLAGMITLSAATEGTALASSTAVAAFTDTNTNDQAGGFTATIDWGDGSTNTGAVTGSNGSFTVSGSHTYADEGSEPLSVTIIRTADNAQIALSGTLTVAEGDSFTPQAVTFAATSGQLFTGTVAIFGDSDVFTLSDDLTASIDWGDGTSQTQGMVTGSNGSFTVSGSHTYATAGQRTVNVTLLDDGSGTASAIANSTATVTVCFCRGTLILTERGEAAVEELAVGDRVVTVSGAIKPIVWIGLGRNLVTRANRLARPVIIRQGALADGVPHRDLYLTHGHALYLDGVLIPVENLINHRSILWDEAARVVQFFHIELEDHDVVLANGAPAESYYDASNRAQFHNTRPGSIAAEAQPSFAPVLNGGPLVERAWTTLFERSGGRIARDTTDDPDLHLVVNRRRIEPLAIEDGSYSFALAGPPKGELVICSRSGVPSLLGITRHDHRRLGAAISRIEVRQAGIATDFEHDAPFFAECGCHPAESGYTWTDGAFELPPQLFAHLTGAFTLTVHTERPGMRYPIMAARSYRRLKRYSNSAR